MGSRILTVMFGDSDRREPVQYSLRTFRIAAADMLREHVREGLSLQGPNGSGQAENIVEQQEDFWLDEIANSVPCETVDVDWLLTNCPPAEPKPACKASTCKPKRIVLKVPMCLISRSSLQKLDHNSFSRKAKSLSKKQRKIYAKLVYAIKKAKGLIKTKPKKKEYDRGPYGCGTCGQKFLLLEHDCPFIWIPKELRGEVREVLVASGEGSGLRKNGDESESTGDDNDDDVNDEDSVSVEI